ncbi:MAG TPA: polyhydroxyalkanoate synthesis regulator DNA-binding domain-containing protein [Anaerolineae bacterium]|nr:polyhydroxyalkanoate synthesis regulator DNA-binding domain-containing protein [Anaerolineae bacterium]HNU04377.1 polyhydroxyalkanoate synthesis regulator DNA-binding domain-containing protein [Anaerolineae bacterium]
MPTVLIKRYPNRKLYNTEAKRYITLDSIAEMIRDGVDVEVRDHDSGEDLTGITLSQIIFEHEKRDSGYLPNILLANLIRAGGDTLGYVRRSFQASVHAVRALEAEVDQRIDTLVRRGEMAEEEAARLREELSRERFAAMVDPRLVDTRVEAALHRLNIPSRLDMVNLQEQLEQLNQALDLLLAAEAAPPPDAE